MVGDITGKNQLIDLGCPAEKIMVMVWGVDTKRFMPGARSEQLRNKLLNNPDQCLVTIVRSLKDYYHVEKLIESAPHVLAKDKNVKFMIIGDGPERPNLEKLAQSLGMGDNIIFTGQIDHHKVDRYVASSDICIDTFYADKPGGGIGVAVTEAMISSVPIITASRPGIEAGVTDGVNGYIFDGNNPKDLADKILILSRNPELRRKLGAKSREIALKIGDWETNMLAVEKLYTELTEK